GGGGWGRGGGAREGRGDRPPTPRAAPRMGPAPRPGREDGPSPWELAAEAIAVKIRWFGLLVGCVLVNVAGPHGEWRSALNALLGLGAAFTLFDTWFSVRGRVFLGRHPLAVSALETLFIALLCHYAAGPGTPFRYYYFLPLICCPIRHSSHVTYATCALHCLSYGCLYLALPPGSREPADLALMVVMLGW